MEENFELLRQEFKEEIESLERLIKERASIGDYTGALKRQSEREAMCRAWQIVCGIMKS